MNGNDWLQPKKTKTKRGKEVPNPVSSSNPFALLQLDSEKEEY